MGIATMPAILKATNSVIWRQLKQWKKNGYWLLVKGQDLPFGLIIRMTFLMLRSPLTKKPQFW